MIRASHDNLQRGIMLIGATAMIVGALRAQDGALDLTFSSDGQVGFLPQIPDVITVDILETGGKIFPILSGVNGGTSSYILKLNNDGSFDSSLGGDGTLEFANTGFMDAALSQDGSKIVLLKSTTDGYEVGAIDQNGAVAQPYTPVVASGGNGFAKMLVDGEGRIVIGKAGTNNGEGCGQVMRLNEDFTPDNTFGTNGVAYTPAAPFCYPLMEIDNLGRIVLGSYQPGCAGMWRFNTDGTVDASFNYTLDLTPYIQDNWIIDFAIAQDNSIYLQPNTWGWPAYLFKLLENGAVDMSFGTSGYLDLSDADPNYYSAPDELLIEPNGGLIVLAQTYGADGYMSAKYLTRLDEFGALDTEFAPGVQPIDDNGFDLRIHFHCATLQQDGKVLAMDMVVKWLNGELHGYAPLITRFHNSRGALTAVRESGPRLEQVDAFPNPTLGSVTLRAPGSNTWRNATVRITNSIGAIVLQEPLVGERIDLSALPAGVYLCEVKHAAGTVHARIVKE
ncbi:MAG: T9SS type A sorting domain-containing protein [Flavobacteriales bacterium]|nr:T9SS type A sorting domain-containing protein [Flavobacteriales bacterium]